MAVEITHIRLSGTTRVNEAITHVHWTNTTDPSRTGSSRKDQMVAFIDEGNIAYVGATGPDRAQVETVHPHRGDPYIRTHADNTGTNNLLSLPTF